MLSLSLSLYNWSSLCRLQLLPPLSLPVLVYVARPLSSHQFICWGRTEGGRGFMSFSTQTGLLYKPPTPPRCRPLPWRLCFLNQTSLCLLFILVFWNLEQFSLFLFLLYLFFYQASIWEQQAEVIRQQLFKETPGFQLHKQTAGLHHYRQIIKCQKIMKNTENNSPKSLNVLFSLTNGTEIQRYSVSNDLNREKKQITTLEKKKQWMFADHLIK